MTNALSKENTVNILVECIFRIIGPFSNVHFKQKVTSKWPCAAYQKQKTFLCQQFAKYRKKISILQPTGSCQKQSIKKTSCIWTCSPIESTIWTCLTLSTYWEQHQGSGCPQPAICWCWDVSSAWGCTKLRWWQSSCCQEPVKMRTIYS